MENRHPYISGSRNISAMVEKLRKKMPSTVTSETVKLYSIAPNNESYVINALQFIGVIDADGNPIEKNMDVFLLTNNEEFQDGFSKLIQSSYSKLFDLYGDEAWTLDDEKLLSFFRTTDKTSDIVGKRQVKLFQVFSALSGKSELPPERKKQPVESKTKPKSTKSSQKNDLKPTESTSKKAPGLIVDQFGMSIKIDVNLPANASKEDYDNIFKSIREHLIND